MGMVVVGASSAPGDVGNPPLRRKKKVSCDYLRLQLTLIQYLEMPTELEEVYPAPNDIARETPFLILLQLVEFLHHGNTQIRQIGKDPRDAINALTLTPHQHVRTSLDSLQLSPTSSSVSNFFLFEI